MIRRIIVGLIFTIVIILILLWFVDGGFQNVRAQANRFTFTSPWPWFVTSLNGVDNFVTGKGAVTLPSVAGVGATTSIQTYTPPSSNQQNETEQERLQQLQQQYENLNAQAHAQGAVQ